jgi:aminopeptidase Q
MMVNSGLCRAKDGCPPTEMVEIRLGSQVEKGKDYSLSFGYRGELNRSKNFKYMQVGNEFESVLLVTQLEPTGARHVLPCLDEPAKKVIA